MTLPELMAYNDRLTVRQGESVTVHASGHGDVRLDVVKLHRPPDDPGSRFPLITPVAEIAEAIGVASPQATVAGSYVAVEDVQYTVPALTGTVYVQPTRLSSDRRQVIWSIAFAGGEVLELVLEDGHLSLLIGDERLTSSSPLVERQWHTVSWSYGDRLELAHALVRPAPVGWGEWSGQRSCSIRATEVDRILLATGTSSDGMGKLPGRPTLDTGFNGKLDTPCLLHRSLGGEELRALTPVAIEDGDGWRWDFSRQIASSVAVEVNDGRHGRFVNMPARGMTGAAWDGDVQDWRVEPSGHTATHFHDDDLDDARWDRIAEIDIPTSVACGYYAVRVWYAAESAERAEVVPFVLTPAEPAADGRALVLAPTYTYIAYANLLGNGNKDDYEEAGLADVAVLEPNEMLQRILDHPEVAGSTYDLHSDGSGRCYSSPRRPIWNLRHDFKSARRDAYRHLAADLYLVTWLEELGIPFDVVTDHQLNREGADLLQGYPVVLTGSHPEYTSANEHRALRSHTDQGGSLLYLGGNGFYWVTSEMPDVPEAVEVRRGFAGTRTWSGHPGEGHHSSTGEFGGLWRFRGLPPNALLGVGFASQGADGGGAAYELAADIDESARFLFDGVGAKVIGERGYDMGKAASDEVDRFSIERGSPPWGIVVGSSQELGPYYKLAIEDLLVTRENNGGDWQPDVRADLVLLQHPSGGITFSVGSIGWIQALAIDDFDNDVARLTENALRRALGRT